MMRNLRKNVKLEKNIRRKISNTKNPTTFETATGVGIKKLSKKAIVNNWEWFMNLIKKLDKK